MTPIELKDSNWQPADPPDFNDPEIKETTNEAIFVPIRRDFRSYLRIAKRRPLPPRTGGAVSFFLFDNDHQPCIELTSYTTHCYSTAKMFAKHYPFNANFADLGSYWRLRITEPPRQPAQAGTIGAEQIFTHLTLNYFAVYHAPAGTQTIDYAEMRQQFADRNPRLAYETLNTPL